MQFKNFEEIDKAIAFNEERLREHKIQDEIIRNRLQKMYYMRDEWKLILF